MKLDAELMFECLIYLNAYYFPVFATSEIIMVIGKYKSVVPTPNIGLDASVTFTNLFLEILKLLSFRRYKENHRDLITGFAILLSIGELICTGYVFLIQCPTLILEKILNVLMIMLGTTEVVFGTMQILPCFNKITYY